MTTTNIEKILEYLNNLIKNCDDEKLLKELNEIHGEIINFDTTYLIDSKDAASLLMCQLEILENVSHIYYEIPNPAIMYIPVMYDIHFNNGKICGISFIS